MPMIFSKDCCEENGRTSLGIAAIGILACWLVLCCLAACKAQPLPNTAVVRYQNQNVMIPMTIENVVEVKTYIVHDAPYQVVVYEKDALTPIVFTQNELVDYRIGDGVMTQIFTDKVYHTYDPFLQQTKNALRKTFIMDTYQHYYGREPTEEEFNNALEKLIQKVQLKDLQVRLLMAPEAVFYRINMGRTKPLTIVQQKYIEKMLEQGKTVEEIAEAFQ